MIKHVKRTIILILAIVFLALAAVGAVLPFLQGWLFLIVGVLLLSICVPSVRAYLEQHTQKYPRIHQMVQEIDRWLRNIIGEV